MLALLVAMAPSTPTDPSTFAYHLLESYLRGEATDAEARHSNRRHRPARIHVIRPAAHLTIRVVRCLSTLPRRARSKRS